MKRIILTGGGTAGHVTPNMALVPALRELGYEIFYIGSYYGIERKLIEEMGIPYYGISSGKLRRYFDVKNFTDPFRVMKGFGEAKKIIKELKPDIVFSKGGFVSVPVVTAAKQRNIPVIIHESDMTPGLANKLSFPSAVKVCCNFPETIRCLPEGKAAVTGCPIREHLLRGNRLSGLKLCNFSVKKPVLLVIGGSLGAKRVNDMVREALPELLKEFQVAHICGKGKVEMERSGTPGYVQFEYVDAKLEDLFAMADLVISRAGANAICELLALKKPNLLIPLPASSSRGDQILNAKSFEKQGFSLVLEEEDLTAESLLSAVRRLYEERAGYTQKMEQAPGADGVKSVIELIEAAVHP